MSSADAGWISAIESGAMTAAETGQMFAVETKTDVEVSGNHSGTNHQKSATWV